MTDRVVADVDVHVDGRHHSRRIHREGTGDSRRTVVWNLLVRADGQADTDHRNELEVESGGRLALFEDDGPRPRAVARLLDLEGVLASPQAGELEVARRIRDHRPTAPSTDHDPRRVFSPDQQDPAGDRRGAVRRGARRAWPRSPRGPRNRRPWCPTGRRSRPAR